MSDLRTALELATDEIESPDLARSALATARRRTTRRRGALAAVAAAVVVAGVVVLPRALDTSDPLREPAGTLTPTPVPSPSGDAATAPPIAESVIQRAWDPSTVANLPHYPVDGMPTILAPVGETGSAPGDTDGVMALSRSDTGGLAVFYGDRGWYGLDPVPHAGAIQDSSLSRDGTRMAVVGEGGLFWCAAAETCPEWTEVDLPEGGLDEDTEITWTPDPGRLIVAGYDTGYLVDLDTGKATELPYLGHYATFDVHHDGTIVSRSGDERDVVEWNRTRQLRSTASGELGGLNDLTIYEGSVAATRSDIAFSSPRTDSDGDGLIVLDRDGLDTLAFLPLKGDVGEWVDGEEIKPIQWLNKVTVLVSVLMGDERHLVTWDIYTGGMGHVTSYPASFDVSLRDLYPA
jgi:hypothetical protein